MPPHEHAAQEADDYDYEQADDDGDTPLHHLRPFGTGLHRHRVAFVRAGEAPSAPKDALSGAAVADLYLRIVGASTAVDTTTATTADTAAAATPPTCDVCHLPLAPSTSSHESCLVHQVSLEHSHPPSALDRSRKGLAVLAAQGWDPDSRRGLGAEQQGIAFPLKPKPRPQRQGLGSGTDSSARDDDAKPGKKKRPTPASACPPPTRTYGAKQIQRMDREQRRRTERLREQIMGNRDLDRYLYGEERED